MNARKRKDEAAAALARGKLGRAAELYGRLAAQLPGEPQLLVRLGEVQRRRGEEKSACAAFLAAARRFTDDGLLLRAIAALKLVLEIDPGHREAELLLAELHARRLGRPPPDATPAQGRPLTLVRPAADPAGPAPAAAPAAAEGSGSMAGSAPEPADSAAGTPIARLQPVRVVRFSPPAPPPEPERLDDLLFHLELDTEAFDREEPQQLPRIPLFADLSPTAFRRLVDRAVHRRLAPGELAVLQGERGDSLFVVVQGELEVVREQDGRALRLALLADGDFFGEMALLSGSPRTASVRAVGPAELLQLTTADLRDLVRQHPTVADALRRFYRQRLLANLLATSPLFLPFDQATRSRIVSHFRTREIPAGQAVVQQGAPVDGLYLVLHGTFDLVAEQGGAPIRTLREGDHFGECALLRGDPAAGIYRARTRGMVLRLPREVFRQVLDAHPQLADYLRRQAEAPGAGGVAGSAQTQGGSEPRGGGEGGGPVLL